jgi:hypothetical protein
VYCTFWQEIKTFFSTTLQHIHHWDGFTSSSTAGRHRFSHTIRLAAFQIERYGLLSMSFMRGHYNNVTFIVVQTNFKIVWENMMNAKTLRTWVLFSNRSSLLVPQKYYYFTSSVSITIHFHSLMFLLQY